MISTSAT